MGSRAPYNYGDFVTMIVRNGVRCIDPEAPVILSGYQHSEYEGTITPALLERLAVFHRTVARLTLWRPTGSILVVVPWYHDTHADEAREIIQSC